MALRAALRACSVAALVGAYLVPSFLRRRITPADLARSSRYTRRLVRAMGWRLCVSGDDRCLAEPGLVVANHMSWLDPLLLSALHPLHFVTSLETHGDRLLGSVARRAGCLFTDRSSSRAARRSVDGVVTMLRNKTVVVFAEATSGDGSGVLPFKPAFFQSAIDAGAMIRPVCIRYVGVDRRPFSRANHRVVCWYGDMDFLPHLFRLLFVHSLEIEIHLQPAMPALGDRKSLAWAVRERIAHVYESGVSQADVSPFGLSVPTQPQRLLA